MGESTNNSNSDIVFAEGGNDEALENLSQSDSDSDDDDDDESEDEVEIEVKNYKKKVEEKKNEINIDDI